MPKKYSAAFLALLLALTFSSSVAMGQTGDTAETTFYVH
jgi:hypothetical protein